MRRGKKSLAWLLIIILCLGLIPTNSASVPVYAAQQDVSSYGVQLTEVQKEIYDALVEQYVGIDGLANGETAAFTFQPTKSKIYSSESELQDAFSKDLAYAVNAFIQDYPQLYWIGGYSLGYSIAHSGATYKVYEISITFSNRFSVTESTISGFNSGVKNAVAEITNRLSAGATMFDKYMAIHDWICQKAYYSENGRINPSGYPETHTAYPIFEASQDSGVVCEGYAKAYKILCDQMQLECMLITGEAGSPGDYEAHMWNKVLMSDGNWYAVDATWDDQNTGLRYDYFLCGDKSPCFNCLIFKQDHIKANVISEGVVFDYPDIPDYGYNGYLGELSYTYNNGILLIGGNGAIPAYLRADRVPWYQYRDEITSIVIGEGITSIAEGCFTGYDCVESLVIPYVGLSKTATEDKAVLGAIFGKTEASGTLQYDSTGTGYYYDIPSSLQKVVVTKDDNLESGAFCNCSNLTSIVLNDGIDEVASRSFYNCSALLELVIPDSVANIEEYAFYGCKNLKRVVLPFVGSNIDASGTEDAVLGYVFGRENGGTIQYYGNAGYPYSIPPTLQSIIITKDTTIPYGAFDSCENIKEIQLQANVTSIDAYAFSECTGLQNITFMGNAPSIHASSFYGCGTVSANVVNSNSTWTDSVKQNYGATKINWNVKNPTDIVAKIDTAKISLNDKIAVKFMVTLDDSVADDDYMKVTVNGKETRIKVKDTTVVQSNLNGKEKHVFVCKVNAKEMTKPIQAQMVVDGVEGSKITYSVKKYADVIRELASGTYEPEKAMIRAMLNYGGYAQIYFKDTSELANNQLYSSATDPVLTMETIDLEAYAPTGTNVDKLTATLLLESETELRFYFTPESGKTLADYSFELVGSKKSLVTGTKDTQCYVAITGICADELQDMYTVTIRSKDTNAVFGSVKYGALSYVRTVLNDSTAETDWKNLVKALYLYNQAALDYSK
ncbi:MAG: leucine-rich repeat protein [Tyzzerella sp.]|nr:leucine-rich repeat protein [Tyzzerella sp.]